MASIRVQVTLGVLATCHLSRPRYTLPYPTCAQATMHARDVACWSEGQGACLECSSVYMCRTSQPSHDGNNCGRWPESWTGRTMACDTRWHAIPDGTRYQMACNTRWHAIPDGMRYQMACDTRWHTIPDGMRYQMACDTRWGLHG